MTVELHGEVVPHHDLAAQGAGTNHQFLELRVQFRGAAGDVQRADLRMGFEDAQAGVHGLRAHRFGARRRGIHVAMPAGLVAELGDVELQGIDRQRRQIQAACTQGCLEVVIGGFRLKLAQGDCGQDCASPGQSVSFLM